LRATRTNDAIAGAYTAKKKSGWLPVSWPNTAAILSGRKMYKPRIPQAKPNEISRNGMNGTVSGMFYALWYLGSWFLFSWLSKITGHTRFIEDFIKNHPSSID
jgi:hypothetical protein